MTSTLEDDAGRPLQSRKRFAYALAVILLLGAVLRLYHLGAPSIQGEEAYHAVVASAWARTGSPLPPSGQPYLRGMPSLLLELFCVHFLPFSLETCVRLPGALFGVLNIGLVVLLGRRYGGWALGLAAGTFFAVSPWCVQWARTARMYEFLLTATLLTFLAYSRFTQHPRWSNMTLLVGTLFLAMGVYEIGVLLIFLPIAGVVVQAARPRVAMALALAAGLLVVFWKLYPLGLSVLIPDESGISGNPETTSMIVMPSLRVLHLALDHAPWLWALGSVTALFLALRIARSGERSFGIREHLALLGILLTGIAGMLTTSTLILASLLAWSGCWPKPPQEIRRLRSWWLRGLAMVTALWILVSIAIALHQGDHHALSILKVFSYAFRYPDVVSSVLAPLLTSPRVNLLLCLGLIGLGLILWRVLREGPLVPQRKFLTTGILFLLATISFIGITNTYYRVDQYLYFLFPCALLSFLEVMRVLASKWTRPARASLVAFGVLFLGLHELPAAVLALPNADGSSDPPRSILQLFGPELIQTTYYPREWKNFDYRAAGSVLREQMHRDDVLLADSAHEMQVYVSEVHGHLSPSLREYESGDRHYLTGSKLLRTPIELIHFLEGKGDRRAWIVLTGYKSEWTRILPGFLTKNQVWAASDIVIYSIPAAEFAERLRDSL